MRTEHAVPWSPNDGSIRTGRAVHRSPVRFASWCCAWPGKTLPDPGCCSARPATTPRPCCLSPLETTRTTAQRDLLHRPVRCQSGRGVLGRGPAPSTQSRWDRQANCAFTPSSYPGCAGTIAAATTSNAASPKARLPAKRSAGYSATSRARFTSSSSSALILTQQHSAP
jgi:hypothetical protein